jgi:hypothetical protein
MLAWLVIAGVIGQPVVTAFALAIRRDGSPFRRKFWTS